MGFWAALVTSSAATLSLAVAATTPPRSGPNCGSGCIVYPYTDVAAFVPRDYLWMYPAVLTLLAFVALAVCLQDRLPVGRQPLNRIGVCFAAIGAAVLVTDYAIQLMVLQPGLLSGEIEGLSVWSQYNPHGIFIGLENLGTVTLGLSFLFLGAALRGLPPKPARAAAWVFLGGAGATIIALILFAAVNRSRLEYRFEVISLLITWLVLIANGILLCITFTRVSPPHAPALR